LEGKLCFSIPGSQPSQWALCLNEFTKMKVYTSSANMTPSLSRIHIVNHGTRHRGEIGLVLGQMTLSPESLNLTTIITRRSGKAKLKRKK
jgi:uncharacterized damage-inducible protein DinB